jgi:hypothetical protein
MPRKNYDPALTPVHRVELANKNEPKFHILENTVCKFKRVAALCGLAVYCLAGSLHNVGADAHFFPESGQSEYDHAHIDTHIVAESRHFHRCHLGGVDSHLTLLATGSGSVRNLKSEQATHSR